MMSSSDLFIEGYPHGTPQGYDDGCRGAVCPAGIEYGLSCKIAKQKSRGDYQYQQLVKKGATLAEIADALGLVGSEPGAPKPKKTPTPTPATARGGRPLADAANTTALAAAELVDAAAELEQHIPDPTISPIEQAWQIREHVGPMRREDGTLNTTAIAEEATLRQRAGLPAWIADLDAPPAEPDTHEEPAAPAPTHSPREIREWARNRGYEVGAKGKIPQHIVDHYWEATGRLDTPARVDNAPMPADEQIAADSADLHTETPELTPEDLDDLADQIVQSMHALPAAVAAHVEDLEDELTELVTSDPDERPTWDRVALTVDLEAARNLACRLEQELARSEEQREADRAQHRTLLSRIRLTEAERDSANHALELAVRKWGDERAANEASYAVILEQAATINRLAELATIAPDVETSMDDTLRTTLREVLTDALNDRSLKFRDRLAVMKQLADLGTGKAHTR